MSDADLFKVYHFDNKIRLGASNDGGYVIAHLDCDYDCYISAGVSNEESFSRDFIHKYDMNEYNCFGFDGTIQSYPYEYTNKISFIRKNINFFNDDNNCNLSYLINKYNNIFLKMDIEGSEYPWLLSLETSELNKFGQIVMELHGITDGTWGCDYRIKMNCIAKISKTHYIVHAHGNNYSEVCNQFPNVIELTFVHKRFFECEPPLNSLPLPCHLDHPNNPTINDIDLNFYPFVYDVHNK
jgi:hypothetical protein